MSHKVNGKVFLIPIFSGLGISLSYYFAKNYIQTKYQKRIIVDSSSDNIKKLKTFLNSDVYISKKINLLNKTNTLYVQNFSEKLLLPIKKEITWKNINQIQLFLYEKRIDNLNELREEFKWLDIPKNKIILLTEPTYNKLSKKLLASLHAKSTKILIITNKKLANYLKIKYDNENTIYIYYPPKIPFTLSTPELIEQNLSQYYQTNPFELSIKYGLFRNEFTIVNNKIYYTKKKVIKLGEVDKEKIKSNISKNGKHLFIYLPEWSFVQDDKLVNFLFEKSTNFSSVNITTSKKFAKENKLFESDLIIESLPQIFILDTSKENKECYRLSYFNLEDNYNKYGQSNLPKYNNEDSQREMFTYVQETNSESFNKLICEDNSFSECLVEIYKDNCPACFIMGKMFDHLSHKFHKHQIKEMKLFRINIDKNEIPLLGEFNATPTFLFIRKDKNNKIEFVAPLSKNNFFEKLKNISQTNLSKIQYHPNISYGYLLYMNKEFCKKDYDPDMDIIKH